MTDRSVLHVICPEPADARGGADLHVRDLARAQRALGLDAKVLVLGDDAFARSVAAAGSPAAAVPIPKAPAAIASFLRAGSCLPPIVHSHGYEADYAACAGHALARRGHLVVTAHGFLRIDLRMRAMTAINMLCLRRASGIIAAGAWVAADLQERFRLVEHIPNGTVGPGRPRSEPGDGPRRLGFVGRMSPEKRPRLVLEIARRLAERGLDLETVLFGGGPMFDALVREAATIRSTPVRLRGFVDDVDAVFDAMDVLVVCSKTESSPRVVLEAMSRGVAVVAYGVGDIPEILDHGRCGLVVLPDNLVALVEGCEHLLSDLETRRATAHSARRRWEQRYQIDVMANHVEDLYARVIGE